MRKIYLLIFFINYLLPLNASAYTFPSRAIDSCVVSYLVKAEQLKVNYFFVNDSNLFVTSEKWGFDNVYKIPASEFKSRTRKKDILVELIEFKGQLFGTSDFYFSILLLQRNKKRIWIYQGVFEFRLTKKGNKYYLYNLELEEPIGVW